MRKIIPHLWYDKEAKEAVSLYTSLFKDSRIKHERIIENTPSGDAELIYFELAGEEFVAISAGPYFKFNPAISLMVSFSTVEEVDSTWKTLMEGGTELMPLGEYPYSKRYGWVQDRYGLSWQLMYTENYQAAHRITPNLLFSEKVCGKTEEAIAFYTSVFPLSETVFVSHYEPGEATTEKAKINYAAFRLQGMDFSAMDNGYEVPYTFNEAFSFILECSDQQEIDYYWEKLSASPEAEQCGWVKDLYGVSWQIVPEQLDKWMSRGTQEEQKRIMEAILKMKKIDISELERIIK